MAARKNVPVSHHEALMRRRLIPCPTCHALLSGPARAGLRESAGFMQLLHKPSDDCLKTEL